MRTLGRSLAGQPQLLALCGQVSRRDIEGLGARERVRDKVADKEPVSRGLLSFLTWTCPQGQG